MTPSQRCVLSIMDQDILLPDPLTVQLGYFGYGIKSFTCLTALLGELSESRQQVLVISTSIMDSDPELLLSLKEQKERLGNTIRIVFLSHYDDFAMRLKVVRFGGDAFFLYPLDISKLMECIEGFYATSEREPYHLLIVNKNHETLSNIALSLQKAGMVTSVARDPARILDLLVEFKPELILMETELGGCSGEELAQIIRQEETFVSIPIVFLSDDRSSERKLNALCTGGDDFLVMPIPSELLIRIVRSKAERTRTLRYFMERDSLTTLLNHTNLKENLHREVLRAKRGSMPLSFAMIDLDHFKKVNDSYGHLAGDRVLKSLSRLLQETLRRTDLIGRYGGEEFGVILINTSQTEALDIMDTLRDTFSRIPQKSGREQFFVTFSCGIASYPEYQYKLTEEADKALYRAKDSGRNIVCFSGP